MLCGLIFRLHKSLKLSVLSSMQRLAGATLLVFANKQDLPGALSKEAIREVRFNTLFSSLLRYSPVLSLNHAEAAHDSVVVGFLVGTGPGWDQKSSLVHHWLQRRHRREFVSWSGLAVGWYRCKDLHHWLNVWADTTPGSADCSDPERKCIYSISWSKSNMNELCVLNRVYTIFFFRLILPLRMLKSGDLQNVRGLIEAKCVIPDTMFYISIKISHYGTHGN